MTYKEEIQKIEEDTQRIIAVREQMEQDFRLMDAHTTVNRQFSRNVWGDNPIETIGYELGGGITHQSMVAVRK